MRDRKLMYLKSKELFHPEGVQKDKKRGTPENEGISVDVYENKRRKIQHFGLVQMYMKSEDLQIPSEYVYESKADT